MAPKPDLAANVFIDFATFHGQFQEGRLSQMPRYQDVENGVLRASPTVDFQSYYFVSHRWDTTTDPDTRRWQLGALRQFASELQASKKLPSCFWYDYSSLPQKPRTAAEDVVFKKGLDGLNALSISCETIALVSGSAKPIDDFVTQLKRGWILCELIVAHSSSQWNWWFHEKDAEIFAASRSRTAEFDPLIENTLRDMPVHDEKELLAWFAREGVECTDGSELPILARRIVEFSFQIHHDKKAALPPLTAGRTYRLSYEEVARYSIDPRGQSPYLPGCTVTFTHVDGGYDLVVTPDPVPPKP